MRKLTRILGSFAILSLFFGIAAHARQQSTSGEPATPTIGAPVSSGVSSERLVKFSGTLKDPTGQPLTGVVGVTFALYNNQTAGTPLWLETQNVQPDGQGNYTVLLGSNSTQGMPVDLFTSGESRWLGVQAQLSGATEQPRVLLVSVPYALKAADADTVGGKPASAFVLAPPAESAAASIGTAVSQQSDSTNVSGRKIFYQPDTASTGGTGTPNLLTKWLDSSGTLGDSAVFESGGNVGIGTTSPEKQLHIDSGGASNSLTFQIKVSGGLGSGNSNANGILFSDESNSIDANRGKGALVYQTDSSIGWNRGNFYILQNSAAGTSSPTLANAVLAILNNGNVGIGTTTPGQKLEVAGTAKMNTLMFADSTTQTSAGISQSAGDARYAQLGTSNSFSGNITAAGNLTLTGGGHGVIFPDSTSQTSAGITLSTADARYAQLGAPNTFTGNQTFNGTTVGVLGTASSLTGTGVQGQAVAMGVSGVASGTAGIGVLGQDTSASGSTIGVKGLVASASGTAGIFDNTAGASGGTILVGRVSGVNKFRVDGTGAVFATAYNTGGADFAESVEPVGEKDTYQPGDVLVIDRSKKRAVALASEPYSTRVAGIYSTKPGVLASPYVMDDPRMAAEIPLAVIGIVPCKVSAENGPIETGDMLVTSSTPGYAMKGTDRSRMLGAVVGKALGPLQGGKGSIQVLVMVR